MMKSAPRQFRVVRVDHDGYNGRDRHPEDRHIGRVVTPIAMETEFYSESGEWSPALIDCGAGPETALGAHPLASANEDGWDRWFAVRFWLCADIETGELVSLLDHEIEPI